MRRGFSRALTGANFTTAATNGSLPQIRDDCAVNLPVYDSGEPDGSLVSRLSQGIFAHLNVVRKLGRPPDWLLGQTDRDRLWTVTLHCHRWAYDLARLAAHDDPQGNQAGELFIEYLADWIDRCNLRAPGAAHLAWNAYATATRLSWWIRAALVLGPCWWSRRGEFRVRFLASVEQQADYVSRSIEWDLRANHLVRDAVGLAWAGRFLSGPRAAKWLATASALAGDQCREQVLGDGGHFERSPMYHLQVRQDLFALSRLVEDPSVQRKIETTLSRMDEFAHWVRHPDGGIPLLNDAALEPEWVPTGCVDSPLPRCGRHFAETGLAIWHGAPWTVFFDVGPLGPSYQPGHGHADNLTLECSFDGRRLFVDPGTHSYDRDERRAYDRSTAAHNTVSVDRADSSEVWQIFRVGRRARPIDVDVQGGRNAFDASAAHDGYSHLGGVIHRRRVRTADGGALTVIDRIEGRGHHRLEGGWLLEPGWSVFRSTDGWELRQGPRIVRVKVDSAAKLKRTVEPRAWHPRFGVEMTTNRLTWEWEGKLPLETQTTVQPVQLGDCADRR